MSILGDGNAYRKLAFGPNLGDIKWVKSKVIWISLVRLHDLNMRSPGDLFATFNGPPKVTLGVIRVFAAKPRGFVGSELLLTVIGEEMILYIDKFAVFVDPVENWLALLYVNIVCEKNAIDHAPFEGMASVSVVMSPPLRCTMITEKHHSCMVTVRMLRHSARFVSFGGICAYPSGVLARRSNSEL